MKKIVNPFALILCISFTAISLKAQNVNVNPGGGSYPTMKAAFDAINSGIHSGAITIDIVGSTTELVKATLNASGTGSASYTSVIITTSNTGGVTIDGRDSVTIKLAGADNVTLDGRIAGVGRYITISNSNWNEEAAAIWVSHGRVSSDSLGLKRTQLEI